MQAIRLAAAHNARVAARAGERVQDDEYVVADHRRFILENGRDPDEITNWRWR